MTDDPKAQQFKFPETVEHEKAAIKHWLPPEKEELEEGQKHAARILRNFELGARQTYAERELAVAMQHEQHYRQINQPENVAHCLMIQGRYEEAIEVFPPIALECLPLIEARDRDDDERCDCDNPIVDGQVINREHVVKQLWMPNKNKFGYLYRCCECDQLNMAVQPPQEIADYHHKRMDAIRKNSKQNQKK